MKISGFVIDKFGKIISLTLNVARASLEKIVIKMNFIVMRSCSTPLLTKHGKANDEKTMICIVNFLL